MSPRPQDRFVATGLPPLTGGSPRERITEAYLNAGYNGHSFSKALGVAYTTVDKWKKPGGTVNPSRETLIKAAGLTGYSVDDLLGTRRDDPPYPAWNEFLAWLETAPDRALVEPWMLDNLRGLRGRPGLEPDLESYQRMLFALLTWKGDGKAPRGPGSAGS